MASWQIKGGVRGVFTAQINTINCQHLVKNCCHKATYNFNVYMVNRAYIQNLSLSNKLVNIINGNENSISHTDGSK